jgi:hypothetical protein
MSQGCLQFGWPGSASIGFAQCGGIGRIILIGHGSIHFLAKLLVSRICIDLEINRINGQ